MIRWIIVWLAAFALRHGMSKSETTAALRRAFRHRDNGWCEAITDDAQIRNHRKLMGAR